MESIFLKIGETTSYKGIRVKCVEHKGCNQCLFCCPCADFKCDPTERKDKTDVIFVAVNETDEIAKDIETLERIAKEYRGRTIENIIENLKQRQKEVEK